MKKLLARLLSLILCVALAVGVAAFPAFADGEVEPSADATEPTGSEVGDPGSCNGVHTWDDGHWDVDKESCDIGRGQVFYKECTKCGAEMHIAFRPPEDNEDHVFTLPKDGETKHEFEEHEYPSECEGHPTVEKVCTKCGHTVVEIGTHNWVEDGDVIEADMCTSNDRQQYKCADCGATKIEEIPNSKESHTFETRESEPTCTDFGYRYRECTKCGYIYDKTVTANPLGHQWESGDGTDHTQDQHCTRCGEIRKATEHTWSGWKYDDDFHWKECTECKTKDKLDKHNYVNGLCECGKTKPVCNHNWVVDRRVGVLDHIEKCTVCGEEKKVHCPAGSRLVPRTYCTDPTYCECGNVVAERQKRHNFGTWICHDETHEHRCLNRDCQYVEGGTHTYTTKGNVTLCSVCKMVNASAAPVHQHTFPDTWTAGTNGCYKLCTDPTCSAMQAASHVLGPADCAGHATCLNCGAVVTTTPSGVHTGGTEIRGAYPAKVGKAGYTGDTYCLVCGRVVAWGSFIDPLTPEHVHNYNTPGHDAYNHWNECSCGEHDSATAHTGGSATCSTLATCSVCGAEYGDYDHTAHVGGTEVRDAKDPAPGVEGYTGDTYCLGCGLMIDQGDVIEALPVPETPTEPDTPTTPTEPVTSDTPATPTEPVTPDTPTTPTEPDTPTTPTEPVTPDTPTTPTEPVTSDTPTTPTEPVTPDVPETPTEPVTSDTPTTPTEPVTSDTPATPTEPVTPDVPETPTEPTRPSIPDLPDLPSVPDLPGITEEPLKPVNPESFTDLPENGYEREAVEFAVNHGLMFGMDEENVSPYTFATRGQVMTILARAVGINTGSGADWDKKGIAWAVENGLTTNDASNPVMTREELMYMLWVMANCPSVDPSVLSGFSDAADVSDVYLTAMAWAVQNGIMDGEIDGSATDLAPGEGVQRVMLAAFIERAIEKGLIG